jgi:hypothetical protein
LEPKAFHSIDNTGKDMILKKRGVVTFKLPGGLRGKMIRQRIRLI